MTNLENLIAPRIPFLSSDYPEVTDTIGGKPIVIKKTPSVQLLVNVTTNYEANIAPQNFQRPESWTKDDQKKYFISLLMDRSEGSIVLVDIDSALYRLRKVAPDDRAVTLYEDLLEAEYKYIVLDGNNRLQLMTKLINGEYHIPEGEYGYIRNPKDTSISTFKVKRNRNTWRDLPEAVKTALTNRLVVVSEYTEIGYDGLSSVFLNTNSGVYPNAQEIRNAMNSPWADYIRALRTEVPELLGYMFPNFKKRYCGDEWLVDCLDFVLQAVDWEEDEVGNRDLAFSGISQGTKNSLYKSEWLTEREQTYYLNVFQKLSEYMTQIIDESNDKQERKRLRRKVLSQNLFWMMCNGINSLEQAKEAVRLHEIATANKLRFFGKKGQEHDDLTFKNACEGSRVANIAFRYEILTEIIGDVTAKFTEEIRSSLEA